MEHQSPVTRGFDLTPDLLARQGRALRGLALSLLGDTHAAEDVVQETWLACLKHPGAYPERVSAWLGTVTKHLALRRLRGDGRREVRERRAAAPEHLEELQQRALEREEALRAVTQTLLALEEPLKTALLLRYYENHSPSEIAAELDVPLATIKSRLARGLERLRAKLGSEFAGDGSRRTRALLALAGLPARTLVLTGGAAGATVSPLGTLALATKLQAAAAALVLAGGACWWWNRTQEERRELASAAPSSVVSAAPALVQDGSETGALSASASSDQNTDGAHRESVATEKPDSEVADAFAPEASFRYRITGQVRDELDLPLANARVFLGPRGFPFNHVGSTDDTGHFVLEFAGRRPAFDCAFTVDDGGERALGLRELHLVSGLELVVDVGLSLHALDAQVAEFTVPYRRGELAPVELFEGANLGLVRSGNSILEMRTHYAGRGSATLDRAPVAARAADGRLIFVDPPPAGDCARSLTSAELVSGFTQMLVSSFTEIGERELFLGVYHQDFVVEGGMLGLYQRAEIVEPAENATIRGVVRDALGNPVSGAVLRWAVPSGEKRVSSDETGAFELREVTAGEVVLRAGGGDRGRAHTEVTLAGGQDFTWNPVLERGDEVTGRVVLLEKANTLSGVLVELWSVSPSFLWCDSTLTDDDGRFAIPNVPPGALELHVYASGPMNPPSAFPIRIVRPVFAPGDLGDIVLSVNDLVTSSLALTVLDSHGDPLPGAEVRVWQNSSARGCFAGEPDEAGELTLAGLPHGSYRVEVGGPFGWRDLGTVWVEADMELPPERFAAAGFAALSVVPADGPALSASLWSTHPDVFGRVDAREMRAASLMLRAGNYVLCAAARKDLRCETALEVKPGEWSALTLDLSNAATLVARPGTRDPALEASVPANCSACHVSPPGSG